MINLNKNTKNLIQFISKIPRMILTVKTFITSPPLYIENSTKTVDKLPNSLKLVNVFLKEHLNIKYCIKYKKYFIYKDNIWTFIEKDELKDLFLKFIRLNFSENERDDEFFWNFYKDLTKNLNKSLLLIKKNSEF